MKVFGRPSQPYEQTRSYRIRRRQKQTKQNTKKKNKKQKRNKEEIDRITRYWQRWAWLISPAPSINTQWPFTFFFLYRRLSLVLNFLLRCCARLYRFPLHIRISSTTADDVCEHFLWAALVAGLFCNDIQMKQLEGALVNQVFCINHPHSSSLPPIDHIYSDS